MQIYDISLTLSPELPHWPGEPGVQRTLIKQIGAGSHANVSEISMGVHTGTHVDAPFHFVPGGKTIDQISLKVLSGRVYVLHLPDVDMITASVLEKAEIPPRTRRLLFKTRNSQYWTRKDQSFEKNFVSLSPDGAELLVKRGLKLVGIDYLSIAPFGQGQETHEILLKAGVVIVEGLNLAEISQGRYALYCLPLKLAGSDGAPARAMLVGV